MADGKHVQRITFEPKFKKGWLREDGKYIRRDQQIETPISHSSLVDRWNELLETSAIFNVKTSEKNKRRDPLVVGHITFFGVIKLLSISNESDLQNIFQSVHSHFPFVSDYWEHLKSVYTEEQLFQTLTSVCKNTSIEIDFDPRRRKQDPKRPYTKFGITADLLSKEIKWVHLYRVEIKIPHSDFSHTITRTIFLKGDKNSKKMIRKETYSVFSTIRKIIVCAFFHELLMRGFRYDDESAEYPAGSRLNIVYEVIKANKLLLSWYQNFLREIEVGFSREMDGVAKIKNSIA